MPSSFGTQEKGDTLFDMDDDDGWEDMPVVRATDEFANGLDEEDQKKYHYQPQMKKEGPGGAGNATGALLDVDYEGSEWRAKADQNESEYTRLRVKEEEEADEVHLRTRYLFDEDQAMTPLSQMQQTKNMLTEAQRIAYVGLCALTSKTMIDDLKKINHKELKAAVQNTELWSLKILGRLYYHMELATPEQKMIENLGLHGVIPEDLVPSLMTTHTVANPEYDPEEARRQEVLRQEEEEEERARNALAAQSDDISEITLVEPTTPTQSRHPSTPPPSAGVDKTFQTTTRVLEDTTASQMPGVSTTLSSADENVTLDIRWTVLCDLFLIVIADSVYDARSRVLLERVALHLGLGWLDVVKFEQRVTEALEIQEGVENLEQREIVAGRQKSSRNRRYMMMGLATLGGGLVIGLSAGLLAPVIGAGLGAALTTVGISGTAGFLGGTAGAAVITTGGVLTGSGIAAKGMAKRTQNVRTFDVLPLHNNKRVNCILTIPGFMTSELDDPRLPFSVLDPIVGDVFSVLWEPDMIRETGGALSILTTEVLSQIGQTVLQATVMTALMSALQWPIILTKLGYLIDNPWSNALDRAKSAGAVLADVLIQRHLGVRPITLIGFSLGARVIFYALLELARQKAYGIVQDVFLLGATLTASQKNWFQVRGVVSGRFVNCYARNDWLLNYLFRATNAGLQTVAGLRPIENVPGLENVDVTDKIAGHLSYRAFMPLILDQLGFPVSADYFDEPEMPDFEEDRIVVPEGEEYPKKKGWFSRRKSTGTAGSGRNTNGYVSRPPTASTFGKRTTSAGQTTPAGADVDDLPPREVASPVAAAAAAAATISAPVSAGEDEDADGDVAASIPAKAGFNLDAMKAVIGGAEPAVVASSAPPPKSPVSIPPAIDVVAASNASIPSSSLRSHSAPPPLDLDDDEEEDVERDARAQTPTTGGFGLGRSERERDLATTFSRSLSLNAIQQPQEQARGEGTVTSREFQFGRADAFSHGDAFGSSPPPVLSFGRGDGALWAPEPPEKDVYGFGRAGPMPTMAFGDAAGGIQSVPGVADPWTADTQSTRKTPAYLANPWDS